MPSLDEIQQEVNNLTNTSNKFRLRGVLNHITDAAKITPDADVLRLINILAHFRGKIANLPSNNRIRADAKDLAEGLMIQTLEERINAINARNRAISNLTAALDVQINKANNNAELLTQIKDAVEKVTKTVEEVKALVNDLEDPGGGLKSDLIALITRVSTLSSIFEPENA